MSHYMTDKLVFIVQANFTWMETVRLRTHCNLHLKIHYVKDFFVTFFLFFFRERKRQESDQRKQKERPWEVLNGTQKIRSKSTSEFWEQETAEKAPASAFLVLSLRITDETPRKCEAWASIFVEMYALHFIPSLESQPFKISHGLSFCFLWRQLVVVTLILPFSFSKEKEKESNENTIT